MKVIIDDKIPYIREAAAELFDEVVYEPGNLMGDSKDLIDADALIIRTRTLCNEALLKQSSVRFIATATIGFDHLDTDFLEAKGIGWTNAVGCNASSVAQYVRCCVILLAKDRGLSPSLLCVAIVGYGHVGKQVERALKEIGCRTLLNDPPLEAEGYDAEFCSLERIKQEADVISFHTPLTSMGSFKTFHLADAEFFEGLRRRPAIINAARGGVVDELSLLRAHQVGRVGELIIDTWENEPLINLELLESSFLSTPHIAGYSADGKSNATRMALRAVCQNFGIEIPDAQRFLELTAPPSLEPPILPSGSFEDDCLAFYDPRFDSERLKAAPKDFELLRGSYPLRREN